MNFDSFYLNIELVSSSAKLPERANQDDAGLDVFSPIDTQIPARGDVLIPLGFKVEFPKGFALIFQEKSGRATKNKLGVGARVVDSGYRGIVHAHLFNHSDTPVEIKTGEKLAQFVVFPIWSGNITEVEQIPEDTSRGAGGFGSSGLT